MSNDFKTVPNQKVIKVNKEVCNSNNYYAAINLKALESAALDLQSGAFKLWVYFAKNQNNFQFALSSKDVEQSFGIKIKQYNNAIYELIVKGYLVCDCGNRFNFYEIPHRESCVITKGNNEDITKGQEDLSSKVIRNNTSNTNNNTKQTEFVF